MKIAFHYYDNNGNLVFEGNKAICASKSFISVIKKQILDNIETKLDPLFGGNNLTIWHSDKIEYTFINGEKINIFKNVNVDLLNIYRLFSFDIFWKNLSNVEIPIIGEFSSENILFWTDKFPTEEQLNILKQNNIDILKKYYSSRNITYGKYKFLVETKIYSEDLIFVFHTKEPTNDLEELLANSISEWNNSEDRGIIHRYELIEDKKNVKKFYINWGSANNDLIDFLLSKFDNSIFNISKIVINS